MPRKFTASLLRLLLVERDIPAYNQAPTEPGNCSAGDVQPLQLEMWLISKNFVFPDTPS